MNLKDDGGGVYRISTLVLKEVKGTISNILSTIFNLCIEYGYFPDELKVSKTIPLHKGNDPELFSNHRPISLLPFFSKLLEKLMHRRLMEFFEKQKLFYKYQFGFRKNHSTYMALTIVIYRIENEVLLISQA